MTLYDLLTLYAVAVTFVLIWVLADWWQTRQEIKATKWAFYNVLKVLRSLRDELAEVKGHLSPSDRLIADVMEVN